MLGLSCSQTKGPKIVAGLSQESILRVIKGLAAAPLLLFLLLQFDRGVAFAEETESEFISRLNGRTVIFFDGATFCSTVDRLDPTSGQYVSDSMKCLDGQKKGDRGTLKHRITFARDKADYFYDSNGSAQGDVYYLNKEIDLAMRPDLSSARPKDTKTWRVDHIDKWVLSSTIDGNILSFKRNLSYSGTRTQNSDIIKDDKITSFESLKIRIEKNSCVILEHSFLEERHLHVIHDAHPELNRPSQQILRLFSLPRRADNALSCSIH